MGMNHIIREVTLGGRFSNPAFPHYSTLPWVEPSLIEGYETTRTSRHIVHHILGRREPEVTFREPSMRSGRLRMYFEDQYKLRTAEQVFALAEVLMLQTTRSEHEDVMRMCFVVDGDMDCELTDTNQWVLTVGYQEVNSPPMPTGGTP